MYLIYVILLIMSFWCYFDFFTSLLADIPGRNRLVTARAALGRSKFLVLLTVLFFPPTLSLPSGIVTFCFLREVLVFPTQLVLRGVLKKKFPRFLLPCSRPRTDRQTRSVTTFFRWSFDSRFIFRLFGLGGVFPPP